MSYANLKKSDYMMIKHESECVPSDAVVGFRYRKNNKPYIGQTATATEIIGIEYTLNPENNLNWRTIKRVHTQEIKFRILKD